MADPKTAEELAAQVQALVTAEHDYSSSADVLWKAALLAFNYAAHQVGATGFQAGWAALRFYGEAEGIKGPFGIVRGEHALFPQYDEVAKVRGWLEVDWRPWLIEEAKKRLAEETGHASTRVVAHWRALAGEPDVKP